MKITINIIAIILLININFLDSQTIIRLKSTDTLNLNFKFYSKPNLFKPIIAKQKVEKKEYHEETINYKTKISQVQIKYQTDKSNNYKPPQIIPVKFKTIDLIPKNKNKISELKYRDNSLFNIKYSNKSNGFYTNNLNSIAEDENGLIWFGSEEDGLANYDGNNITTFDISSFMNTNIIYIVLHDSKNRIWIATDNGIFYIKKNKIYIPDCNKKIIGLVQNIIEDKFGNIWICTRDNGAIKYNSEKFTIYTKKQGLSENSINTVLALDNEIWFGYAFAGFSRHSGKNIYRYFNDNNFSNSCLKLFYAKDSAIWISFFDRDILKYKNNKFYQYNLIKNYKERIFDIKENKNGLWIAIFGKGLCNLQDSTFKMYNSANGLLSNYTYRLYIDNNNNVWIADYFSGFERLDENVFEALPVGYLGIYYLFGFLEDKKGNLYFQANGSPLTKKTKTKVYKFVNKTNNKNKQVYFYLSGAIDNKENVWFGTINLGLIKFSEDYYTFYNFKEPSTITHIVCKNDNSVWFGTNLKGVVKLQNDTFFVYNTKQGLSSNKIAPIEIAPDSSIWIGTINDGITILRNDSVAYLNNKNTLSSNVINCIFTDNKKRIWVGTPLGIDLIMNKKIYHINHSNGLPDENVNSIIQSNDSTFWISSSKSVSKLIFKSDSLIKIKNYNSSYGINVTDFGPSFYSKSSGEIYWFANNHILKYNPEFKNKNIQKPKLFLTKYSFDNKTSFKISKKTIQIKPDSQLFINYYGICWGYEKSLIYKYALIKKKGDTLWINNNSANTITLDNIHKGEYTLAIKVLGIDEKTDIKYLKLKFLPNWWQTLAFKLVIIILIFFSVILFFVVRMKNEKKIQLYLENEIALKTKELLEENKLKDALIGEIHHRVKNNLQTISSLIYFQLKTNSSENEKSGLKNIQTRVNSMAAIHNLLYSKQDLTIVSLKEFIANFIAYIKTMISDNNQEISIEYDIVDKKINLSKSITLGLMISEIITNSIKHAFKNTQKPKIIINIKNIDKKINLFIKDNGCGIKKTQTSLKNDSLGLKLIDIFSRELDAKLEIINSNGLAYNLIFEL